MNRNFAAEITANINKFMANVRRAQAAANSLQDEVTVNVNADTAAATAQISRFRAMLKSIPNKFRVRADVDQSAFDRLTQSTGVFKNAFRSATSTIKNGFGETASEISMMQNALMALAPAAIPIVASLVPAVMAVGNALAVVGGGVIGLAGAFAIAGAGALAFGGMAMSAISMLNDGLIASSGATQYYQSALQGVKAEWAGLIQQNATSIFTALGNGIQSATIALQKFNPFLSSVSTLIAAASNKMLSWVATSQTASNFFNMMGTTGVSIFADLLNALGRFGDGFVNVFTQFTPLFKFMSQGLQNMATDFQNWSNKVSTAQGIQNFINYTKTNLPLIGQIFGNTFKGIFNLFTAFSANSQTIFQSLADMSARFAAWSATIAQSQGFKQFIDYVQTQGPVVMSTIGNIVNAVIAFATAMAPVGAAVLGVVSSIAQWVTGFAQAHPQIIMVIGAITTFIGAMGLVIPVIMNVVAGIMTAIQVFNTIRTGIQVAATAFTLLASPIGIAVIAIGAIVAAVVVAYNKFEWFRNAVNSLGQIFVTLGQMWMQGVQMIVSGVTAGFSNLMAFLQSFNSFITSVVANGWNTLTSVVSTAVSVITSVVSSGFSAISSTVSSIMSSIGSAVSSTWSSITSAISSAVSSAVSAVSSGFSSMMSAASSAMSNISSAISSAWSAITSTISSAISSAVSAVTSGFSNMMSAVSSFASNLVSSISTAMSSFTSAVTSGISTAVSAVASGLSNMISTIRGFVGQMVSAGADLVNGFVNGITSMIGNAVSAAASMASQAVSAVKSFLKIGSPSKVLKQIGQWMAQGFALGIEKDIPKVKTATQKLFKTLTSAINKMKAKNYSKAVQGARAMYDFINEPTAKMNEKLRRLTKERQGLMKKISKIKVDQTKAKTWKQAVNLANKRAKMEARIAKINTVYKKTKTKRDSNRNLKLEVRTMQIYMTRIAKKREEIAVKLDKAKEKLQKAIDKRTDFKNMIRDDLRGYASITNTDRKTAAGMQKVMAKRLKDMKAYYSNIQNLKKLGINKSTLKEILDSGIETGGSLAKGLVTGGKSAVSQINKLQSQINSVSSKMGTKNASDFYQAGVDAANGIVKGLQKQDKALKKIADKLANTISSTIKKRLKIKSPSRVMMAIGGYVGAGLVNSLNSARTKVATASTKIASAIEKNVKPDMQLTPFDVGGRTQDIKRYVSSTFDATIQDGIELPQQNITIVVRSDMDIDAITHAVEQVQGTNAAISLIG